MQILSDSRPGHASRWLGAAYLAFAAAVTLPSAKATAGTSVDLPTLEAQDEGQREQLAQLRQALVELRKQQAELARQLEELNAGKAKRPERTAKDDEDDDDEAGAPRARRLLPLNALRRARDTKPEEAEGEAKKSATRAFKFDGKNLFQYDGKRLADLDANNFVWGKSYSSEDGMKGSIDFGKAGEWFTLKDGHPGWKVWRSGDGDDAGKAFHVQGGEGTWVFQTDGEEGDKVLWTGPDGKWQTKNLPKGAWRLAPSLKVERGPDGNVFRYELESKDADEDADDDASVDVRKARSKKTRKVETVGAKRKIVVV